MTLIGRPNPNKPKYFWVGWISASSFGAFELQRPWWITGSTWIDGMTQAVTVCAALIAKTYEEAVMQIFDSYDNPPEKIKLRFIEQKPDDWSPFTGRFEKSDWMKWPPE